MCMELRLQTKEEVKNIYNNLMTQDFPDAELKPLESILKMMEKACYEPLGAFENDEFIGYAFMTKIPGEDYLLLDYLAVDKNMRQSGFGKEIIKSLKTFYKGKVIFIESEDPSFQEGEAKAVAKKRLSFYESNGVKDSGILSCIFTAHYINYYLSEKVYSREFCKKALEKIYVTMVPKKETRDEFVVID